jgi:DNA-binding NarL/FixJ family response regulator
MRNTDVAGTLHISVKTVESHLSNVYRKLGVSNRTALAQRLQQPDDTDH